MVISLRNKSKELKWLSNREERSVTIDVSDRSILEKLKMIDLTVQDLQISQCIQPMIEEKIELIVDSFYDTVLNIKELKEIIEKHSHVDRLRKTLSSHLLELFNGSIDETFIEKRLRVAKIHFHIGLKPAWFMGSFQNLQNTLLKIIFDEVPDRKEMKEISLILMKIVSLEQQIVLEAYEKEHDRQKEVEYQKVKEEIKKNVLETSSELASLAIETNQAVEALMLNSEKVNELITHSNEQSRLAHQFSSNGQHLIDELTEKIQLIIDNTNNVNQMVQQLILSSNQITNVIKLVQEIANQTNLLALNSAIEAARAGEHGKGFAVVAGEVKRLAEQTKQSIAQIQSHVETSSEYARIVNEALHNVNEAVVEGKEKSAHTNEAFQHIASTMDINVESVSEVQLQMGQLVENIRDIREAMSGVTESAEHLNQTANLV
nr:globin-coupled sensor protein [Bacillus sp. 03113]